MPTAAVMHCEHCRAEGPPEGAWVQVDFPDRAALVFCGFKCVYHWARNHVEAQTYGWTAYREPRKEPM